MSAQTRELYHSANGDRCCLAYDSAVGRVFVRHEPNPASGGKTSDIEIGTFLSRGGQGPEKQELLLPSNQHALLSAAEMWRKMAADRRRRRAHRPRLTASTGSQSMALGSGV